MKIKELIRELSKYSDDLEVVIEKPNSDNYREITDIFPLRIVEEWAGYYSTWHRDTNPDNGFSALIIGT